MKRREKGQTGSDGERLYDSGLNSARLDLDEPAVVHLEPNVDGAELRDPPKSFVRFEAVERFGVPGLQPVLSPLVSVSFRRRGKKGGEGGRERTGQVGREVSDLYWETLARTIGK